MKIRPTKYEKELFPKKTRLLLYIRDKDLFEIFSDSKLTITYLQKEIGYNSPSHVHQDLLDLEQAGYIKYDRTKDIIRITDNGKRLTAVYGRIRLLSIFLSVFGLGFFPILLYMKNWIVPYTVLLSLNSVGCGILMVINLWKLVKEKKFSNFLNQPSEFRLIS